MGQNVVPPVGPEQTHVLGLCPDKVCPNPADHGSGPVLAREFHGDDSERHDLTGLQLGSYLLAEKLGEGGMGTLFRARHQRLGKACAIKFIHPRMANDSQAIQRFLQEIQAIGQLNHPHIVNALDAGCCDGVHYYVTELLTGRDLKSLVQHQGPIGIEQSATIIAQVLHGLAHAHEHGFVHRDIKPSNIFWTDNCQAKLLDFGLVRHAQHSDGLTSSEQLLGTLDYLAPEQGEDPAQASAASDIYSLGMTWIYLLSGKAPFPDEKYATTVSKLRGQLIDQPEWLTRNPLHLPADTRALISAMIAKDPHQRLQSCREALGRLQEVQFGSRSHGQGRRITTSNAVRFSTFAKWAAVGLILIPVLLSVSVWITTVQANKQSVSTTPEQEPVSPAANAASELTPADEPVRTLSSTQATANAPVIQTLGPSKSKTYNSPKQNSETAAKRTVFGQRTDPSVE